MKDHDDTPAYQVFTDAPEAELRKHRPRILHVDVERFQHHLDNTDLTDAEKAEYLHIIWSTLLEFMDLGYGVHPLQQSCGQDGENASDSRADAADLVSSANPKECTINQKITGTNPEQSEVS